MEKLKINIVIAGRNYPLSVSSTKEEEGMRKAAKSINKLIALFEQNYAVSDKQDVLAMCALQFASQLEQTQKNKKEANASDGATIARLNAMIEQQVTSF